MTQKTIDFEMVVSSRRQDYGRQLSIDANRPRPVEFSLEALRRGLSAPVEGSLTVYGLELDPDKLVKVMLTVEVLD